MNVTTFANHREGIVRNLYLALGRRISLDILLSFFIPPGASTHRCLLSFLICDRTHVNCIRWLPSWSRQITMIEAAGSWRYNPGSYLFRIFFKGGLTHPKTTFRIYGAIGTGGLNKKRGEVRRSYWDQSWNRLKDRRGRMKEAELHFPGDSLLRARTFSSSSTFPSSPRQMFSLWWIYFGTRLPPTAWNVINGQNDKFSGSYFARWAESAVLTWLSCYRAIILWEPFLV